MLRRNNRGDRVNVVETPDSIYVKRKFRKMLFRLMVNYDIPLEESFFDCLQFLLVTLKPIANKILDSLGGYEPDSDADKDVNALRDYIDGKDSDPFPESFRRLSGRFPALDKVVRDAIKTELDNEDKGSKNGPSHFSQTRRQIRRLFGLSETAINLCEFVYFKDIFNPIERYFSGRLQIFERPFRRILAATLGVTSGVLERGMSELISCGILETRTASCVEIDDDFASFFEGDGAGAEKFFCRPVRGKTLPLHDFTIPNVDMSHVTSLLKSEGDSPIHILFYGPPGTGKTTCAVSIAKALGLRAWYVPHKDESRSKNRRIALSACMNVAAKKKGAFVIMDEADRFLDTGDRFGRETVDKAWINGLMERQGARVIWIMNDVRKLDASVARRFAYSVHFEALGITERLNVWTRLLGRNGVKRCLSKEETDGLARRYEIPPSVIESAICQAKSLCCGKRDFSEAVECVIRSYATLLNDGIIPRETEDKPDRFTITGSCIGGSVDEFLERCRRADAVKRGCGKLPPGGATMLFYGPSGAGKSALARHLSRELGRKLIVKRASDILSPFVGMSEQLIADAFRETEREDAVLLIDEADSFLYSRDSSFHTWENTMVNEFLTSLDECREFCICTTNRIDGLDPAALRRFSFKMPFTYAKPEQVETLYDSILAPYVNMAMSGAERKKLLSLSNLTPGDFHVVKNQNWLAPKGDLTHEKFIAALEAEQNAKLERAARRVGF